MSGRRSLDTMRAPNEDALLMVGLRRHFEIKGIRRQMIVLYKLVEAVLERHESNGMMSGRKREMEAS